MICRDFYSHQKNKKFSFCSTISTAVQYNNRKCENDLTHKLRECVTSGMLDLRMKNKIKKKNTE